MKLRAQALGAADLEGQEVRLEVRYGTDRETSGDGFRFDEVTFTDVFVRVADVQADVCVRPRG